MLVRFFDTKPYDRRFFEAALAGSPLQVEFREPRLDTPLADAARGAQAVCVFVQDHLDAPCLELLVQGGLKMVALRCAGFNNVDLAAARRLGIAVTRVPAYSPHAVAEHAVALLLTLNRKTHRAFNRVRELNFSLNGLVGFDLHGRTVGVIGTGRIGRIFAEILKGFGSRVLCHDPYPADEWAAKVGATYLPLEDVLRNSDILSLHTPLTPETHHLINERTLRLTKSGVIIINTSRGKLIDTKALIAGLKSGHIGGVGLDVYEEEEGVFFEDLSGSTLHDDVLARLISFPNALVTAHQAFLTQEALGEIARVTVANLRAYAEERPFLEGTVLVERPTSSTA